MFPELVQTAAMVVIIGFFFRLIEAYFPETSIGKALLFVY